MKIVPFESSHCKNATAHPSQAHCQHMLDTPETFRGSWPGTLSAMEGKDMIAIGGTALIGGTLAGWVLFSDQITPPRFVAIHRAVVRFLTHVNQPVMSHVDPEKPKTMRWAKMLDMGTKKMELFPDGREMLRTETHVS